MDINTMICDLIGFFNGFTRVLCQDYNCYLGSEAIYNERCFLHLRKNNNDSILVICREHSGAYEYNQTKSLGQIKPKNRNIIENNDSQEIFEIKNRNILNFMKFHKIKKKKELFGIKNLKYEMNKEYYDEYNNNYKRETIDKMNFTIITNNLDLPSESQIFENKVKTNEYEQVLEVFDFINNVTQRNNIDKIENSKNTINKEKNNNNYNNNEIIQKNNLDKNDENQEIQIQSKNTFNFKKGKNFQLNKEKNYDDIQRNKTQNFNKMITIKNMELIKNIDFNELNDENNNNIYEEDDNYNKKYENNNYCNNKISEYDNSIRESLMNNFNLINNNYIDQESTQSYEQLNNFNYLKEIFEKNNNNNNYESNYLRNNTLSNSMNNLNNNMTNSIKNSIINHYESSNIYYPSQNINNEVNLYDNSNSNNHFYYPIKNNNPNLNQNTNSFINNINNSQIPNNNFNKMNQNQFSQYDLSFL